MEDLKSFKDFLDIAAKENKWDDWNDVLFNSRYDRTKGIIMKQAFVMYQNQMKNIISFDDKDEDEKLQTIEEILNLDEF